MININDRTIHEQLKYNISNDERSSHEYFFHHDGTVQSMY